MSLNKEVEVLRDVPLFNKIDHTKLKLLAFVLMEPISVELEALQKKLLQNILI